jgi:hypothetical protein
VLTVDEHVEVEVTREIYQHAVAAHRHPDKSTGTQLIQALIDLVGSCGLSRLVEVRRLGRTLSQRSRHPAVLRRLGAFDRPTEAINGHLEHLRGSDSASGTDKSHYPERARFPGFRPQL